MTDTIEKPGHKVSVMDRQEIDAPRGYVSVFHETTLEAIPGIDQHGVRAEGENKNIGTASAVGHKNALMDQDRPDHLVALGVSRSANTYAYPFLSEGHGLYGADQRFIGRAEATLNNEFATLKKYGAETLMTMGVTTADEYARKMQDPAYLKEVHPGEVLELKVDPTRCFVGNLTDVTNLFTNINRWGFEPGDAKSYWDSLITLEDFLKFYKKAEWAEDNNSVKSPEQFRDGDQASPGEYCPIAGAPDDYPWSIMQPEILIPDDVPQEHIRVVQPS